jgi:PIN domain nuclease of toxin-antitoxin system
MRLLLDTQIFVWLATDNPRLGAPGRKLILEAEAAFVSSASIWELAIKAAVGKFPADVSRLAEAIPAMGLEELPVTSQHALGVMALPDLHKDPFDRILVAQAMAEPLRLVTADPLLVPYSELVLKL